MLDFITIYAVYLMEHIETELVTFDQFGKEFCINNICIGFLLVTPIGLLCYDNKIVGQTLLPKVKEEEINNLDDAIASHLNNIKKELYNPSDIIISSN